MELERLQAQRDAKRNLIDNNYLKKQSQLEEQQNDCAIETNMNMAKSADYEAAAQEQSNVISEISALAKSLAEKEAQLERILGEANQQ